MQIYTNSSALIKVAFKSAPWICRERRDSNTQDFGVYKKKQVRLTSLIAAGLVRNQSKIFIPKLVEFVGNMTLFDI